MANVSTTDDTSTREHPGAMMCTVFYDEGTGKRDIRIDQAPNWAEMSSGLLVSGDFDNALNPIVLEIRDGAVTGSVTFHGRTGDVSYSIVGMRFLYERHRTFLLKKEADSRG